MAYIKHVCGAATKTARDAIVAGTEPSERANLLCSVIMYDGVHSFISWVCRRFLAGGTNDVEANVRRHGTVKLIPRISQGAWFVKQAVGTTPCLLGRKLTTSYHRCTERLVLYTTHCWIDDAWKF